MNKTITSRDDFFLAKVAGRDITINSLTPPVASSVSEELMLEVADRIDRIESGSCGVGAKVIHITESSKDTYTADISCSDLIALILAGESVVAQYVDDEIVVEMPLNEYNFDDKVDPYILFSNATASREDNEGFVVSKFAVYDVGTDTWSYNDEGVPIPRLPDIKNADNGKVLTAINGEWVASEPFIVELDSGSGGWSTEVTYEQLLAAYNSKRGIMMYTNGAYIPAVYAYDDGMIRVIGNIIDISGDGMMVFDIQASIDQGVNFNNVFYQLTPGQ